MKESVTVAEVFPFGEEGCNPAAATSTFIASAPSPGRMTAKGILW